MNTMKNLNHVRSARRAMVKRDIKRANNRRCPLLFCANKHKPPQPTIIKLATAKRFHYLEQHGLARFRDGNLVVEHTSYRDPVLGMIRLPSGIQSVGV